LAKEKVVIAKFALSHPLSLRTLLPQGVAISYIICPQNPISVRKAAGPLYLPGMKN